MRQVQLNANGVRKFQRRVVSTLGPRRALGVNAEGVGESTMNNFANSFRVKFSTDNDPRGCGDP